MINKTPPLNRDYNRDPNMKALKRRGFINHGSTLSGLQGLGSVVLGSVYRRIRLDCQIPLSKPKPTAHTDPETYYHCWGSLGQN